MHPVSRPSVSNLGLLAMSHMLNYSAPLSSFVTTAKQLLDARNVYELRVTV